MDLVIATGVLEHVEDGAKLIAEISRIVEPGGMTDIEMPFLQQYHDDPIDCRRYTRPASPCCCASTASRSSAAARISGRR